MKVTATISLEVGDERVTLKTGEPASFAEVRSLSAPPVSGKYHQLDIGGFSITIEGVLVGWVFVDELELENDGKFVEHWALLDVYFPPPGENQSPRSLKFVYVGEWSTLETFKTHVNTQIRQLGVHVRYIRTECARTADWHF